MSNICNNSINIRGSKENIIAFVNKGLSALGVEPINSVEEIVPTINKYPCNKRNPLFSRCTESTEHKSVKSAPYQLGYFSLECFVPMPQTYYKVDTANPFTSDAEVGSEKYCEELAIYHNEIAYQKETYGIVGWYNWRAKHFGDKWNCELYAEDCVIECDGAVVLSLYAESAWSPIDAWLKTVQDQNRTLRFQLVGEECGNNILDEYTPTDYAEDVNTFTEDKEVEFEYFDRSDELVEEDCDDEF